MDIYDAFLYNLHAIIGHDSTARVIGQGSGDKSKCHLCHPERCDFRCRDAHLTRAQIKRRWPDA